MTIAKEYGLTIDQLHKMTMYQHHILVEELNRRMAQNR